MDWSSPVDEMLDVIGLKCPEPLMMLRQALRNLQQGQLLGVVATDPSTERDFANFCQFIGHELVSFAVDELGALGHKRFEFVIRKGT